MVRAETLASSGEARAEMVRAETLASSGEARAEMVRAETLASSGEARAEMVRAESLASSGEARAETVRAESLASSGEARAETIEGVCGRDALLLRQILPEGLPATHPVVDLLRPLAEDGGDSGLLEGEDALRMRAVMHLPRWLERDDPA